MSGACSNNTCRHAPHGELSSALGHETAILTKSCFPSEIALNNAVRSAQIDKLFTPFSTLAPVKTVPSEQRSAAPTGNSEYGQYARSLA